MVCAFQNTKRFVMSANGSLYLLFPMAEGKTFCMVTAAQVLKGLSDNYKPLYLYTCMCRVGLWVADDTHEKSSKLGYMDMGITKP